MQHEDRFGLTQEELDEKIKKIVDFPLNGKRFVLKQYLVYGAIIFRFEGDFGLCFHGISTNDEIDSRMLVPSKESIYKVLKIFAVLINYTRRHSRTDLPVCSS